MNSALFLDRDGVINVDYGYVHTAEKTRFVSGIFSLVQAANEIGMKVVVVTNQAGIGRGLYSEPQFFNYMNWVKQEFVRNGAHLDAVYYCPHHPDAGKGEYMRKCACRKPQPGMFLQAAREHMIDLSQSVMVGDSASDAEAASAAGVKHIYLLGSHESSHATRNFELLSDVQSAITEMRVAR